MAEDENRGMGSYIFLLLLLSIVLAAMIACIVLLRQIDRNTAKEQSHLAPAAVPPGAPLVIPREEATKPHGPFVIPPPPKLF
jgi:hypothetical protein